MLGIASNLNYIRGGVIRSSKLLRVLISLERYLNSNSLLSPILSKSDVRRSTPRILTPTFKISFDFSIEYINFIAE